MTLKEYWVFLTRLISLALFMGVLLSSEGQSQEYLRHYEFLPVSYSPNQVDQDSTLEFPDPKKVLRRSLIIPGWGQISNDQVWKVPIIYGVLGGLTYYSIHVHKQYNDYRAAYYNTVNGEESDFRFGRTPSTIPSNLSANALRDNRDFYRNRRDLVYVLIGVSYILNAVEAYVYAHLRTFDVSDDLSMNLKLQPKVTTSGFNKPVPSISISFNF